MSSSVRAIPGERQIKLMPAASDKETIPQMHRECGHDHHHDQSWRRKRREEPDGDQNSSDELGKTREDRYQVTFNRVFYCCNRCELYTPKHRR